MNPVAEVEHAGADRHRRGQALLLEEPDVEGGVAGGAADEPGEGVGELDADDGTEGEAGRHRAEHGHRLGELGELGEHEGQQDPPPDRSREDVAHGGHAGELGDEEVDAEGERGGQEDRAEREAVQLGRASGGSTPVSAAPASRRSGQASLRLREVALGGTGQRGGLEEGQQLDEIVRAEAPLGGRQRPVLAHELGAWWRGAAPGRAAGGRPRRTRRRRRGRRARSSRRRRAPRCPPRGCRGRCGPSCSRPRFAQASSRTASVTRSAPARRGWSPGGFRTTRRASSRQPASAGGDDLGHPGAGAAGEEQHVGLVLDLVLAGQRQRRPGVLVPDEPPELGEQAGVGAVPAHDLDRQLARRPRR